jgi:hypothetical protein
MEKGGEKHSSTVLTKGKGKGVPRLAEVALGVPVR